MRSTATVAFFSAERREVERHPEIRLGIGQLDLKLAHDRIADAHADAAFLRAGFHRQIEVMLVALDLALRASEQRRRRRVAENDLVHVDVTPAAFAHVEDFKVRGLPREFLEIPACRFERFGAAGLRVRACRGAHRLAVDDELHARLPFPAAAADEECQVAAADLELRRRERAGGVIATDETVHQALSRKALHLHLLRKRAARRCRAHRAAA